MTNAKTDTLENSGLLLLFNNTTFAGIGDATGIVGSTAPGSLWVSLHTSDPGETGSQTSSEISYTGYARIGVVRSSSGWTVSANSVSNAALITFGAMTAGTGGTVTHIGIGSASSGAGKLLYRADGASLAVTTGITPEIAIGACTISED